MLLYIAGEIGKFPSQNEASGKHSRIDKVFHSHGTLRINVTGFDPLRDPKSPRMTNTKVISLKANNYGEIELTHPWRNIL